MLTIRVCCGIYAPERNVERELYTWTVLSIWPQPNGELTTVLMQHIGYIHVPPPLRSVCGGSYYWLTILLHINDQVQFIGYYIQLNSFI